MKATTLRTVLTSAYLTAMLTSSVTPVRCDVTLLTAGSPVAQSPAADPVMTDELMGRLVTRTLASEKNAVLKRLSGHFGLNDGTIDMQARQVAKTLPDSKHFFNVPLTDGHKDIVIMVKRNDSVEAYLTDRSGVLRDAAIIDSTGIRRITKDQAADKYKAELALYAKEAALLPPTGKN